MTVSHEVQPARSDLYINSKSTLELCFMFVRVLFFQATTQIYSFVRLKKKKSLNAGLIDVDGATSV